MPPPLEESGGEVEPGILSFVEIAILIGMIMNRKMNGDKLCLTSHTPNSHTPKTYPGSSFVVVNTSAAIA